MGANVQPGQLVIVHGYVEHTPLMRAAARRLQSRRRARRTPPYTDSHFTRALLELGPTHAESLERSMPWLMTMLQSLEKERGGAYIQLDGEPDPYLLADLPGRGRRPGARRRLDPDPAQRRVLDRLAAENCRYFVLKLVTIWSVITRFASRADLLPKTKAN